jgi:tetratricopeptide (TPR) repeat protein
LALVAAEHHAEALKQLDLAVRLDPGYWPIYLQRARALLRAERLGEARDDLLTTLDLRPELGLVHKLLADTALKLGDSQLAWYHAIRAGQDGVDVTSVRHGLMRVSEAPSNLAQQLNAVRVFVDVGPPPDEFDQSMLLELLRVLRREMSVATDIALVSQPSYATAAVILEAGEITGQPRRLEGKLVINGRATTGVIREEKFEINDLDDPNDIVNGISEAAQKMREWIQKTYG